MERKRRYYSSDHGRYYSLDHGVLVSGFGVLMMVYVDLSCTRIVFVQASKYLVLAKVLGFSWTEERK